MTDPHRHRRPNDVRRAEPARHRPRAPAPARAAPPPSPPVDEYDLARGREQLRRLLAK